METIGFHAHGFVLLDAVSEGDLQTGRYIYETLKDSIYNKGQDLFCRRVECQTAQDLLNALKKIEQDTLDTGKIPFLHIEGHGEKENILLPNGCIIGWDIIFNRLRDINILTRNNLFFVSGACESAYAYKAASITKETPVFAMIAPSAKVEAGMIKDGYSAFYKALIVSKNLNAAFSEFVNKTNPKQFSRILSQEMFQKAAFDYLQRYCHGKGKRQRQESLLTEALNRSSQSLRKLRKRLKQVLRDQNSSQLEHMHRKFMIIDRYPENALRFKFDGAEFERKVLDIIGN